MKQDTRPAIEMAERYLQTCFALSGKRSLILTGEKQCGKTSVLRAMTNDAKLPGFHTYLRQDATRTVWLQDNLTDETVQIGRIQNGMMQPMMQNFETRGVQLLQAAENAQSEFVLLDEIGFLECNCPAFCAAVLHVFDKKRLLAVVRKQTLPFLDALKQREDVYCVDLETLYTAVRKL